MEKKNINIVGVRNCTILLLTVFTIGRKYGQEQNATNLINDLRQQPCACCLNFDNVSEEAKEIDNKKTELEAQKNQLEGEKRQFGLVEENLRNQMNVLQNDNNQLRRLQGQLEEQKRQLIEERNARENEKNKLQNNNEELLKQINNLQNVDNENTGAAQVAQVVNEKFNLLNNNLNKFNELNRILLNEKQKISEEKTTLEKALNEYKQNLQEKDKEFEKIRKEIEDLNKNKEKIESDMKTKNKEIESYKKENNELNGEKTQLEKELKELQTKNRETENNYKNTISNYEEVVKKNAEATNNLNVLLKEWKKENEDLNKEINVNTQKIEDLNNKIKENELNITNLSKEKNKLEFEYNELNKNHKNLEKKLEELNLEKISLEKQLNVCTEQLEKVTKEKESLAEILNNTKTNVNTEEYVKFYNSKKKKKKTKIGLLLHTDAKILPEKKYTFYIPFKFKEGHQQDIINTFAKEPGIYTDDKTLYRILQGFFEGYAVGKFKKDKIINVTILKEIYFYLKFNYDENKNILYEDKNKVLDNENQIVVPEKCFYSTLENIDEKNKNEKKIYTTYDDMADGTCYKKYKDKVQLDYSNLIELVAIDVYLKEMKEHKDNKDLFLLELDFEDPECIALLEFVGKGNYGVVKKGLTFENGELVTKKEVLAGKIINEIGVGNKIAFVQDYMTINEFIKRSYSNINGKIVYLKNEESKKGNLKNAVDTTFLNKNLETLPSGKTNVYKDFENNVFNKNGKIDSTLYIMFMDIVNGEDLFLNEKKREVDIDRLGDMLFDVLNNLYVNRVALKDIKPKNIIWDKKNNKFSIIDVQTLGQVGRNLTDSCGTPELWPFFKTLNLNLESKNEIKNESKNEIKNESKNEIKDNKIKDNDGKDNLYDLFCNSIDDNFVDIYAACMTMYFAKFSTYTAAGLLFGER